MKFRIKHAQQVVGFFLVAAALTLIAVLVFMGANQRWFDRNYVFFSRFSSAEGISTGMSVRLKGFEIGKVTGVQLNNFNRVRVEVSIFEDYYPKIRPDSVLELSVSPLGLGSGSMNLLPGLNMLPPMEERSFLPSTESTLGKALLAQGVVDKPLSNDAIQGIISQIEPMLIEVRGTVAGVTKVLTEVDAALKGRPDSVLGNTLADANKVLNNIDLFLTQKNQESSVLIGNLNTITADFARMTSQLQDPKGLIPKLLDPQGSLKTLLDDKNVLFDQLTQILGQVNSSLAEVKGLTAYLNRSTPQISGLMEDTKNTLKKTDDVLTGLSNNPFLKGGIPERKAQTSTLQGARDEEF